MSLTQPRYRLWEEFLGLRQSPLRASYVTPGKKNIIQKPGEKHIFIFQKPKALPFKPPE